MFNLVMHFLLIWFNDRMSSFSCPHITPKPNEQGKIFWLSGPPGAGKSTNCQLLAKHKNFIYYEADCTMSLINPFTDLETENPSMASFNSKALKVVYVLLLSTWEIYH